MKLVLVKTLAGCVLFLITFVCLLVPYFLFRYMTSKSADNNNKTTMWLNCLQTLAGGVFLGTCLVHLLPEAREAMNKAITSDLPVTEMTVSLGILFLLAFEHIVLSCSKSTTTLQQVAAKDNPLSKTDCSSKSGQTEEVSVSQPRTLAVKYVAAELTKNSTYCNYGSVDDSVSIIFQQSEEQFVHFEQHDNSLQSEHSSQQTETHLLLSDRDPQKMARSPEKVGYFVLRADETGQRGKCQSRIDRDSKPGAATLLGYDSRVAGGYTMSGAEMSAIRSYVLLLALSFHTVFDGLVVGLQQDEAVVWTLLVAIGLHKGLVAFSLSLSLLQSHPTQPTATFLYLVIFSLIAPLGLVVGTLLTENELNKHAQNLASGVLQSLATGTFMYVTFFEGLKDRFEGSTRLPSVCLVVIGCACVCVMRMLVTD